MTKNRIVVAGAAVALTLGLGAGIAAAQTGDDAPSRPTTACPHGDMDRGDIDAMHAQMRADMPDDMQAQCDTMHAQDGRMDGSMMDGGMMTGEGMMGAGMTRPT